MSKRNNNNYKNFDIIKLEDGMSVLGSLIRGVVINLKKYKEYSLEVDDLFKKYIAVMESEQEILIPAKEYDDIDDKLLYRQREILKFVADEQKSSFSYINLRKILLKKNFLTTSLKEEETKILNEFLNVRNWSFHNPRSMMVANSEVAQKRTSDMFRGMVKIEPQLNPLIITHTKNYDLNMLCSLTLHVERRINEFEAILEQMKNDYIEMYQKLENKPIFIFGVTNPQEVLFYEDFATKRFWDFSSDVIQLSMAIQKSKYDGSEEKYNQWVMNKIDKKETQDGNEK